MNHKWKDNRCERCGIRKFKKSWKKLMAVTNFPPWNIYKYGTSLFYLTKIPELKNGSKGTFKRPDCMLPTPMSETSNKSQINSNRFANVY